MDGELSLWAGTVNPLAVAAHSALGAQ